MFWRTRPQAFAQASRISRHNVVCFTKIPAPLQTQLFVISAQPGMAGPPGTRPTRPMPPPLTIAAFSSPLRTTPTMASFATPGAPWHQIPVPVVSFPRHRRGSAPRAGTRQSTWIRRSMMAIKRADDAPGTTARGAFPRLHQRTQGIVWQPADRASHKGVTARLKRKLCRIT